MELMKIKNCLEEHSLFQVLLEKEKELLLTHGALQHILKNHYIIHEKQDNDEIYLLIEGLAKNTFIKDDGEEMAVLFYHPGDLIGIISAITHRKTQFSVQATSDVLLLKIPHEVFSQILKENLIFSEKMIRKVSQRLDNLYEKMHEDYSFHSHGLDPYPYRKKIGEIMTSPAVSASPDEFIFDVMEKMDATQISSLVIVNDQLIPLGMVTQKDVIHAIVTRPADFLHITASELISSPLFTLHPDAYFYEALLLMVKHGVKHIPIISFNGTLEGIITMSNLTQARGNAVLSVVDKVESQSTIQGLVAAKKEIQLILESMMKEKASAHEMCNIITELNDRLLRRIIGLCEQQLMKEGQGLPPVEYCWLTMGSEGRREQTLSTDQDNAIIYQDVDEHEQGNVITYFSQLAEKVVSALEQCGFPRCTGNVMATNPRWCHSLSEWKQEIDQWLIKLEGQELRNFTIFLDFRGAYGQLSFAEDIRQYLIASRNHYLIHRLAEDDLEFHVPLGAFGRIITKKSNDLPDALNLKNCAVMHIVNAIRILSLHAGISAVSTMDRLKELQVKNIFTQEEVEEIEDSFNILMVFRIKENLKQIHAEKPVTNFISIGLLDKSDYIKLKKALSTAKWIQQMIARRFHVGGVRL